MSKTQIKSNSPPHALLDTTFSQLLTAFWPYRHSKHRFASAALSCRGTFSGQRCLEKLCINTGHLLPLTETTGSGELSRSGVKRPQHLTTSQSNGWMMQSTESHFNRLKVSPSFPVWKPSINVSVRRKSWQVNSLLQEMYAKVIVVMTVFPLTN